MKHERILFYALKNEVKKQRLTCVIWVKGTNDFKYDLLIYNTPNIHLLKKRKKKSTFCVYFVFLKVDFHVNVVVLILVCPKAGNPWRLQ